MTVTARIPFSDLDLAPEMVAALTALGFTHPTEVQALAIPRIMAGKDLLVQSRTGTGKTLGYGIPIVQRVDPTWKRVQALVLSPTRELALQVRNALAPVAKHRGVRVVALYGGDSMRRQMDDLREPPQVVTATPGRLLDHLGRRTLSLSDCFFAVLDEADEMLSMGFYEEVERIMRQLPGDRQTLLFSATIPQTVLSVAHNYLTEPERMSLSDDYLSVREIEHQYVLCPEMEKDRSLARLLEFEDPDSCIIFCNTRDEARRVAGYLKSHRFGADLISGELTQRERERVMARIKAGHLKIMVATDVAARGIDVVGLSHVICYSTSESPEVYIHRSGRTGRVGRRGKAISLVSGKDLHYFNRTEKANGLKIPEIDLPPDEVIRGLRANRMWEKLKAYAEEHELDPQDEVSLLVPKILESPEEGRAVLYALLKHFFEERKFREKAEPISVEAPEGDEAPEPREEPRRAREDAPADRRGGRRGRGRDRDRARSQDDRPSPRSREPRAERGPVRRAEGPREHVVLAMGTSAGLTAEDVVELAGQHGLRAADIEVTLHADEAILTVPGGAAVDLLARIADEHVRGVALMPMQLMGPEPVARS